MMLWLSGCGSEDSGAADAASGGTATTPDQAGLGGSVATGGATTSPQGGTTSSAGSAAAGGAAGTTTATANGGATAGRGGTSGDGAGAGGAAGTAGGKAGAGGTSATIRTEFWISPTGKDNASGTKEAPLFSLCDSVKKTGACYRVCGGGTCWGSTIWVTDGTYKYTVTQKMTSTLLATASGIVKVFAEAGAKPVFDFSGVPVNDDNRGLQVGGNYWHIKGITVTNAGDTGIFVMGSNNIIEQCVAHHNKDAGIIIGINSDTPESGKDNLILNCDSYQNNDTDTNGENADGFGMKENSGTGNVFRGCRAWDNADDGWDLYGWASPVTIDNCWAISQGKTTTGSASDGNGFKLGGKSVSAKHILSQLYATDNRYGTSGRGFTNNSNPASMSCTNCASWGNKAGDEGVSGVSTSAPSGATAEKMIAAKRNADGSLPDINSL